MKYQLSAEKCGCNSEEISFLRYGSGVRSFLCSVSVCKYGLDELMRNAKIAPEGFEHSGLSFVEKLAIKYMWRAKKFEKIGTFTGETPKSYIIFYYAIQKNGEKFIYIRSRNQSPYYEQSCAFTYDSVLATLIDLKKEITTTPTNSEEHAK